MRCRLVAITLFFLLGLGVSAASQFAERKVLTLEGVKRMAAAAEAEAVKNKWNVVIAIVDEAGYLLYLQRLDDVQIASIEIAVKKARSASLFRRPTKVFEDQLAGGRSAVLKLPGAMPFEGGLPIIVNGKVVGGIGVSGAISQQDAQVAMAGLSALAAP